MKLKRKAFMMLVIILFLVIMSVVSTSVNDFMKVNDEKYISVVLSTSDFSEIYHDSVTIHSSERMKIEMIDGVEVIPKNELISIDETRVGVGDSIHISADGAILVDTITRSYGVAKYLGEFDIINTENGFVIVNTLPLETYLRFVVPSEMPADFGIEAVKAQVICARNFAIQHINNPSFPQFNAHLDDSIRFQVYNNQVTNEIVDKAIQETRNKVLTYNNEIISTYYFSTSWGHTTDLSLWNGGECEYYKAKELSEKNEYIELTTEESFKEYLVDGNSAYENCEPWFRWNYVISLEEIEKNINDYTDYEVKNLESIDILKRRSGGSVSELKIMADDKELILTKESDIRNIFIPTNSKVSRKDGSVLDGYSKCPSSYFLLEPINEDGVLVGYELSGGGCGHGLGMSQNCAKHLALKGFSYSEILSYFYPNTEVSNY